MILKFFAKMYWGIIYVIDNEVSNYKFICKKDKDR